MQVLAQPLSSSDYTRAIARVVTAKQDGHCSQQSRRVLKRKLWQLCLLCGALFCADGIYLQAKAWLAQILIAQAWGQSLAHDQNVKPWPWADTWPVARLQIPTQAVDLYILDGSHGSALAFGPGRLNGTANPGEQGLSIVGGHRDTHFRFLREVQAGEFLDVTNRQGHRVRYQVEASWVADTRTQNLTAAADEDRLLLITCYPFDALIPGGPLRYVVSARPLITNALGLAQNQMEHALHSSSPLNS